MRKKHVAIFYLLPLLLLLLSAMPTMVLAAPNVIEVTFYQDNNTTISPNFILGSGSSGVDFTAVVINYSQVPYDTKMTIANADGSFKQDFAIQSLDANRFGYKGTLPAQIGKYSVSYASPTTPVSVAATTLTELNVHYRAQVTFNKTDLKVGDTGVRITCTIYDRSNNVVVSARPQVTVEGATLYSSPYYNANGTFTLDLNQITQGGTGALRLLFDNVIVGTWDVTAAPFPALKVSPGALQVDNGQPIYISAMVHDYNYSSLSLREEDNNQLLVELSGVSIIKSSITRTPLDSEMASNYYGEETYRRVVLYASDLAFDSLRFISGGTLRMRLYTQNESYQSIVELPVQYGSGSEGLLGAPAYQSYAGENELNLQFSLPNNKLVSEYTAWVNISGGESYELHEGGNGGSAIYQMTPITYYQNGKGTVSVQATTTDSEYDTRSWTREFSFSVPSLEVSQTVVQLDEEQYVSVFLRNAEGYAINDATVVIDGVGSRQVTSNGEYIFNSKWTSPGYKRIQAFASDGSLLADFSRMLKVQPPEILLLIPDTETLLSGASQTISFTIIDQLGKEMSNARVRALVDGSTVPVTSTWNSANKTYQVRVQPTQRVVFYAESGDGRRVSPELEMWAVLPEVKSNLTALTNLFMERLELSFINPVTEEALSGTVTLRTQNVQIAERNIKNNTGGTTKTGSSVGIDLYKRVLSGSADPTVFVDFTYSGKVYKDLLVLPISEAKITVTPSILYQGVQEKATLELLGASDNPLTGIEVKLQGTTNAVSVTTNEQGKASFSITPAATATEYLFSIQRSDSFVQTGGRASTLEKKIPVGKASAPVLTIENLGSANYAETDNASYTLKLNLSDEEALDYLMIDDRRIALDGKSVQRDETLQLVQGDNSFTLALYNKAELQTTRQITIRYTPPTPSQPTQPSQPSQPVQPSDPPAETPQSIILYIGSLVVTRGSTVLESPPVAPKIINGRTMLPFRYLCQTVMQGTVDYAADTRKITTYVNGHEIIMQVDNLVMTVDGEIFTLTQAPIIDGSHTMVPVKAFEQVVSYIAWDAVTQTVTIYP